MLVAVICSPDMFLGGKLAKVAADTGKQVIRTSKFDRVVTELKQRGRIAIIDMTWKEVQKLGPLRQLVNLARISGNEVVTISPNDDEDLKRLAKAARVHESFLRYDLETRFKDYMELAVDKEE